LSLYYTMSFCFKENIFKSGPSIVLTAEVFTTVHKPDPYYAKKNILSCLSNYLKYFHCYVNNNNRKIIQTYTSRTYLINHFFVF